MLTDWLKYPHSYPFLHLFGQYRSEQSHGGIEYDSNIVVVERFEPSRHTILESHQHI